tara:strand:+ start:564 stop:1493 length:930 start_codon:yes stop_codon:yes gene_type:complete
MFGNDFIKQKKEVSGWWNTDAIKKWDIIYDEYSIHDIEYLKNRQKIILDIVDNIIKEKKVIKVLELGYGGGQTALELGMRGLEVYGLDISRNLCDIATKRCEENYPEGKYFLDVGSIEENYPFQDSYFDIVIVCGALQYLFDISKCMGEVNRVLKPGGRFIVAQRNHYSLSNMTTIRNIIRTGVHFLFQEEHELHPSYKSILVESKLGKFFKKHENKKFMNSSFMLKGYDKWKYKIDKKRISSPILSKFLKENKFTILDKKGSYYCFSEKPKYYNFNIKFDSFYRKIADLRYIPLLKYLGRSIVIHSKK